MANLTVLRNSRICFMFDESAQYHVAKKHFSMLMANRHESLSPLRVEQRKLQDRLAALERLTREHTAPQAATNTESKGEHQSF